jgi:hypothetical protein
VNGHVIGQRIDDAIVVAFAIETDGHLECRNVVGAEHNGMPVHWWGS